MDLETTKMKCRTRNRWLGDVREDGKLTSGKAWKERVYNREEWNKLLRMATSRRIFPVGGMNE
jgi:hypothetical protein